MQPEELKAELTSALADRQLLNHPFYRRWQAGELNLADLAAYAGQYRHFEAALPDMLRRLLLQLGEHPAAGLVRRNLNDEECNPRPHVELFMSFADAVGASREVPPTAATQDLIDTYAALVDAGAAQGLAGLVAYEMQAPAIAASKGDGLRKHFGVDAAGTEFWDIHATMDEDHADWTIAALAGLPVSADMVVDAARSGAEAWWAFLDECQIASTHSVAIA